jgi:hypothetical protein
MMNPTPYFKHPRALGPGARLALELVGVLVGEVVAVIKKSDVFSP